MRTRNRRLSSALEETSSSSSSRSTSARSALSMSAIVPAQYIGRKVHTTFAAEDTGEESVWEGVVTAYDKGLELFNVHFVGHPIVAGSFASRVVAESDRGSK